MITETRNQTKSETTTETTSEVDELMDLVRVIDKVPLEYRADLYRTLDRLVTGFEQRQHLIGQIQDTISQMSLDIKYMIFDLEATRKERDMYRAQLEYLS
ncbi:MAG: transcriptional regulator [Thermoguttaceae bacterium]